MKKIIAGLISFLFSGLLYALTIDELPNEMYLSQHWVSYTTSFDIETKTQKIGTLYRRFFSLLMSYDFYNNSNQLLTTAQARFFSVGAHFDVYDAQKNLLGWVEEKIFTFFPTFTIYSPQYTKLASAEMNFWGTTFTIYDPQDRTVMATMWRSFFRIKNDWTIDIKNRSRLKEKNIDPSLLMTVLAFQGDREYWQQQQNNNTNQHTQVRASAQPSKMPSMPVQQEAKQLQQLQDKIKTIIHDKNLEQVALMDETQLENLANKLETDYQAQASLTPTDNIDDFVDFCLQAVESDQTTVEEKRAILYLLQLRIGNAEPSTNA